VTTAENELRLAEQTITYAMRKVDQLQTTLRWLPQSVVAAQQHLATLDAQLSYSVIGANLRSDHGSIST
jgi:hypothetical protein